MNDGQLYVIAHNQNAFWLKEDPSDYVYGPSPETIKTMNSRGIRAWQEAVQWSLVPWRTPWGTNFHLGEAVPIKGRNLGTMLELDLRPGDVVLANIRRSGRIEFLKTPPRNRPKFPLGKFVPSHTIPLEGILETKKERDILIGIDALVHLIEGGRFPLFAKTGIGKTTMVGAVAKAWEIAWKRSWATGQAPPTFVCYVLFGERPYDDYIVRDMPRGVRLINIPAEDADLSSKGLITMSIIARWIESGYRFLLIWDSLGRAMEAIIEKYQGKESLTSGGLPRQALEYLRKFFSVPGNYILDGAGSATFIPSFLQQAERADIRAFEDIVRGQDDGRITLSPQVAAARIFPAFLIEDTLNRQEEQLGEELANKMATLKAFLLPPVEDYRDEKLLPVKAARTMRQLISAAETVEDIFDAAERKEVGLEELLIKQIKGLLRGNREKPCNEALQGMIKTAAEALRAKGEDGHRVLQQTLDQEAAILRNSTTPPKSRDEKPSKREEPVRTDDSPKGEAESLPPLSKPVTTPTPAPLAGEADLREVGIQAGILPEDSQRYPSGKRKNKRNNRKSR